LLTHCHSEERSDEESAFASSETHPSRPLGVQRKLKKARRVGSFAMGTGFSLCVFVFAFVLRCHPEPSAQRLRDGGEGAAVAFVAQSLGPFARFCGFSALVGLGFFGRLS